MVIGAHYSTTPFISRKAILEALNALLQQSVYEPRLSLYYLTLVDEYLALRTLPPMENARAYALSNILANMLIHNYQKYRVINELPALDLTVVRSASLTNITEDAATSSSDLISWSLLYYRYIRTELELSQEDLSTLMSISDKTVRRYQSKGLNALKTVLISEEQNARSRVKKLYLQAALPSSREVPLFGRESLAQKSLNVLLSHPTLPVILTGPMGTGKTTLAQEIVRRRIHMDTAPELRKLIWVNSPVSLEDVLYKVQSSIAEADHEPSVLNRSLSFLNPDIFIVIDNADALRSQDIEHCLQAFSNAALLITIRSFQSQYQAVTHLSLTEFTLAQTERYIEYLYQFDNFPELMEADIQSIYRLVGGNPLAIRFALQSHYSEQQLVTINNSVIEFFQHVFHALLPAVKHAWVILALASHHGVKLKDLNRLFPRLSVSAFFELVDKQIAQYNPDNEGMMLLSVARTALLTQQNSFDTETVQFCIEAISEFLAVAEPVSQETALFLESMLTTALDFQLPLPFQLIDQSLHKLRKLAEFRTPHVWLKLLEWRVRQQTDSKLALEFACALRRVQFWERAQLELERIIENSGREGLFIFQAEAMLELGILMRQRGAYPQAEQLLRRASQIAVRFRTDSLHQEIQLNFAQIAVDQANPSLALSYLEDLPMTIQWLALRGETALLMGDFEGGIQLARKVIRQSAGKRRFTAILQILLGRLYHAAGDHQKARREIERAVITLEEVDASFALGRAWMNLGIVFYALEYLRESKQLLLHAAKLQEDIRDVVGLQITLYNLDQLGSSLSR
jgi:tetratricopeptide (TPR) repeat protein